MQQNERVSSGPDSLHGEYGLNRTASSFNNQASCIN